MLARRSFLCCSGAALAAPHLFAQNLRRQNNEEVPLVDQVPPMLDHILVGCNDLQKGIDFIEQHTGVRAAFGGVHPGRGTQNALLSLGASTPAQMGHYLEIIALDPKQERVEQDYAKVMVEHLKKLTSPALVGWAAHTNNIEAVATKLKSENIPFGGPYPGSRRRPDGNTLQWKTINLQDDANGLLPFFIEWGQATTHPSTDAPQGCQLLRFELATPNSAAFSKLTEKLALKAPVTQGEKPQLRATLRGPKSQLFLTS